uniref:Coat protein n=1 Tax=Paraiba polycipivirus TaxID=2565398 RepID=A0A4P8JAD8_9VIRU|nr:coat protein [Paraiba polycipivirus]
MINSYALADTSMFRHFELSMPYDYPTPFYDQYAWMARRATPGDLFEADPDHNPPYKAIRTAIQDEPHGDNWIVFGLRGNLEATVAGAQVIFELEYRCAEGFQFADPFFPPSTMRQTMREMLPEDRVLIFPRANWTTDGIGDFNPPPAPAAARTTRSINIGVGGNINIGSLSNSNVNEAPETVTRKARREPVVVVPPQGRRSRRVKRDDPNEDDLGDEGIDVVDPSTLSALDRLKLAASRSLGSSSRNE